MAEHPYGDYEQQQPTRQWIHHLPACVELQMLLVPRSDTSDADKQYRCDFAVHKIAVVVNHPLFDASVNVGQYAAPVVKHCRVNGIFKELQQHGHIYHCAEYFIEPLQFLTFFHKSVCY